MTGPRHGAMGPFIPHLQPGAACEAALAALADSSNRLRLASETVDADDTAALLSGLAVDRQKCRSNLVRVAVESGLDFDAGQSGTWGAAIGDGWLRIEGALEGDAEVIAAVRREEDDLLDVLARVLEVDLPSDLEHEIRATAGRVAEDMQRLDRVSND